MRAEIIRVTRVDQLRDWLTQAPRSGLEITKRCRVSRAMLATILIELQEAGLQVQSVGQVRQGKRGPLSKLYQIVNKDPT